MLASKDVLENTYKIFSNSAKRSFAKRFLDALDAGQAEGGANRDRHDRFPAGSQPSCSFYATTSRSLDLNQSKY